MEASARCCKELSAYCAAMVLRMSFSCSYTLSTPSVEGAAKVSSSAVMIAKFWMALVKARHCPPPPSRLIILARSASSVDLR
jgi:hypothetical protein